MRVAAEQRGREYAPTTAPPTQTLMGIFTHALVEHFGLYETLRDRLDIVNLLEDDLNWLSRHHHLLWLTVVEVDRPIA